MTFLSFMYFRSLSENSLGVLKLTAKHINTRKKGVVPSIEIPESSHTIDNNPLTKISIFESGISSSYLIPGAGCPVAVVYLKESKYINIFSKLPFLNVLSTSSAVGLILISLNTICFPSIIS